MIEVNLLKQDALNVVAQELGEDLNSFVADSVLNARRNKRLLMLASVTIVAWVVIIFFFGPQIIRHIMNDEVVIASTEVPVINTKILPEDALKEVEKPLPHISINEENVVEEIVMGVRQSIEKKKKKVIPKLLDFEKIHNQKLMIYTGLKKIGDAASLKVTFGKMVLKVPNFYYLHGLASDKSNFGQFKNKLIKISSQVKQEPIKKVGLVGKTREFTVYGSIKTPEVQERKVALIEKGDIRNYNRDLIDIAENMDIHVMSLKPKTPRKMHNYKSYSYRMSVKGRYNDITEFVKTLHNKSFPVGILQLSVVPTKDQKMLSTFDLVYYAPK